jgi:hypothetical protein
MLRAFLSGLKRRFNVFKHSPSGKKTVRMLSVLFPLFIVAYLIFKLTRIGWNEVWLSLPAAPLFYIIWLFLFLTLPVFQVIIFKFVWKKSFWRLLPVQLNKWILDKNVLDLSGDVYLYFWAKRNVNLSDKEVFHSIKDNTILSAAASTFLAAILLLIFVGFDVVILPEGWSLSSWGMITVIAGTCLLLAAAALRFRKILFSFDKKTISVVFLLHLSRLFLVQILQVIQWAVVLPEVPLINWITLLSAQIIISRIPLLPSRNLIFLGAGLEMSEWLRISTPSVAGMLLTVTVLNQVLYLVFFTFISLMMKKMKP